MKKIGITFLAACLGGAVAIGTYKLVENKYTNGLTFEEKQKVYFTNNPSAPISSSTGDLDFTQAAAAVTPAVVHIKTTYNATAKEGGGQDPFQDMFEDFFGNRRRSQGPMKGSGSGVIISDDGYIVTNNHVVDNADIIDVILPDKRSLKGKIIGRDANTDLALIKIEGKGFPIVKLGNSDNVRVGEWVLAVGYPFALNTTVTAGIVSAKGRSIGILNQSNRPSPDGSPQLNTAIESFIQTDAAINRGNSGGALVNTRGELIGINAAIASQTGNYEGYGFAIPINLAKKILDDFREFGTVKRGYIGVSFQDLDAERAKALGVDQINGLYVQDIVPGGGAQAAGIQQGDILTKVNGTTITSSSDLQEMVGRLRPGDKVQLAYLRDGKERNTTVVLKGEESVKTAGNSRSAEVVKKNLGASFAPLNETLKKKYKINSGLIVTQVRPGGFFDQIELPEGTIIVSINGKAITKVEDIESAISSGKNNMATINAITPDGYQMRYQFQVR
ncbi:Do family serine endopeptidase [Daejeonella oryzae]|uniref:Do family serine endopeptidase n=1 Tax=Daejeonella oryzae TaxID=1122943 RepID=UPI00041A188D|nr:Do family serine endopeptidase [Daejeonella oryzae]